jgi:hypothetical protein
MSLFFSIRATCPTHLIVRDLKIHYSSK